jgi:hypothetical protein
VNTSDTSLTITGSRGPLLPQIDSADGSGARASDVSSRIENGGGGWGLGAETPYLNPGGVLRATYGIRALEGTAPPSRPFIIEWAPTGGEAARFEVR